MYKCRGVFHFIGCIEWKLTIIRRSDTKCNWVSWEWMVGVAFATSSLPILGNKIIKIFKQILDNKWFRPCHNCNLVYIIVFRPSAEHWETSLHYSPLSAGLRWAVSIYLCVGDEKYCVQTWEVSGWNVLIKISDRTGLSVSGKKNYSTCLLFQFESLISAEISRLSIFHPV